MGKFTNNVPALKCRRTNGKLALLLILSISKLSFSQITYNNEYAKIDKIRSVKEINQNSSRVSETQFNKNGNIIVETGFSNIYLPVDSKSSLNDIDNLLAVESIRLYTYDSLNNLLQTLIYRGNYLNEIETEEFKYNNNNNRKISKETKEINNGILNKDLKESYTYNENNKIIKTIFGNSDSVIYKYTDFDSLQTDGTYNYIYDNNKNLIEIRLVNPRKKGYEILEKNSYNKENKLISKTGYSIEDINDPTFGSINKIYEYDNKGNLIYSKEIICCEPFGTFIHKYEYNSENKILIDRYTFIQPSAHDKAYQKGVETITSYDYNLNGQLIKEIQKDTNDKTISTQQYVYDGNLLKEIWLNDELQTTFEYTFYK